MARLKSSQPTEVELQILRILWDLGPSPVRVIHEQLSDKGTNYSTTVKMLSVMLEKGLLKRKEGVRPHIYRVAESQEKTQQRMLSDLIEKAYSGSALSLVMQALSEKASPEELQQVRELLDQLETKS